MTNIVSPAFVETARLCADAAASRVVRHFRIGLASDAKADDSPVTAADREAEQAMRAVIASRHPDHAILGEEFGGAHASGPWCWVIDPIDGTRAFITGRPSFTTLVALFHNDVPVLGVVDQPVTGERWVGVTGHKTLFESRSLPGTIGTRRCVALAAAELSCTSPDIFVPPFGEKFNMLRGLVRRTSWGGDAYAYGLLALGQIDIVAECTMKPWDWGALVPVVQGAGGRVTDWSGDALTLESAGDVLACGDAVLHAAVVRELSHAPSFR